MSAMIAALETLNQFLAGKFQNLFIITIGGIFVWYASAGFERFNSRLDFMQNVEIPQIREEMMQMRSDIKDLDRRLIRLEEDVHILKEDVHVLKVEMQELRVDVKEVKADIVEIKSTLAILVQRK
jgi:peptidoglycan hydrolase CwlO-like protein